MLSPTREPDALYRGMNSEGDRAVFGDRGVRGRVSDGRVSRRNSCAKSSLLHAGSSGIVSPIGSLASDIRQLDSLPKTDVVAAGFPCQDLSQAGRTVGISGRHSGLIGEVFRLLPTAGRSPEWLVLENVPFMLHLARGRAMAVITTALEERGYRWAYRTVDTLAFGAAAKAPGASSSWARGKSDPRTVLFADDTGESCPRCPVGSPRGFYWTEGRSGHRLGAQRRPAPQGRIQRGHPVLAGDLVPRSTVHRERSISEMRKGCRDFEQAGRDQPPKTNVRSGFGGVSWGTR